MTTITAAQTRVRPAAALLEGRLGQDVADVSTDTAELDALAIEQARISLAISQRVARMDDAGATPELLDELTDEIAALLATAEDVRAARARAAARRAGDERRWAAWLDLA